MTFAIKDWPKLEQPREKLLSHSAVYLSDAEVLSILISSGVNGETAVDLGRRVLNEFGGLRNTLNANIARITRLPGIGTVTFVKLQASLELGKRYIAEQLIKDGPLTSPQSVQNYLVVKLRDKHREVFSCLFLDTRHQVIAYEELFHGTVDGASVYPRVIVQRALHHNAAAIIAAHNHPSGVSEPSRADETLTRRIQSALELVDMRLLDHFVIGDGECSSLAERGII